ncbi:MAG: N-acetyltransferase [Muribaculaceae bacterium]
MAIEIREIHPNKKDLKHFVKFPINLYKGNPYFVPPLIIDEINTLTPDKNPAFEFCESIYFMAYRDGVAVGRIAGIINNVVNEKKGTNEARFGFVDFIDDNEVSKALFDAVESWAKKKGKDLLVGPLGFSDMDPEGMLIDGFDKIGTMATIYNFPYYPQHIANLGFEKEVDWMEYLLNVPQEIPEKHQRISDIIRTKYEVRSIKYTSSKKIVKDYGQAIFELINEAYAELYGYSPLSPRQIDQYIKTYIPILRLENIAMIVDKNDALIGVGIAIPSMSKALQKCRGKFFPFGWYYLLKALKAHNDVIDLLLVAVKPEYQNKGVSALIFADLIPIVRDNKVKVAESNPELELNQKVQLQWQYFDTTQHKRRRAFKKSL